MLVHLPYLLFTVGVLGNKSGYHCLAPQTSTPPNIPLFYCDKSLIERLDNVNLSPVSNESLIVFQTREDMTKLF